MKRRSDRLSNLPDSVLLEILSLLKAREVVQTSVLSKRWLNLWASVPCLNFDMADFCTENSKRDIKRFKKFASRFLDLREDCINTDEFVLRYVVRNFRSTTKISRSVKRWILYALKHNPKNLRIDIEATKEKFHLPDSFFTCESLEEAHLCIFDANKFEYQIVADRICLPNLRTIHLSFMIIDEECMKKIIHGCPVLKELSLDKCLLVMDDILFQSLHRLTIDSCDFDSKSDPKICAISAPNLEMIELVGVIHIRLKLKDMSRVKEADIACMDYVSDSDFLSSLSGVVNLCLSFFDRLGEMLGKTIQNCPIFYNLKILELSFSCVLCTFGSISSFLALCPNLEELIIHQECEDYQDHISLEKILEEAEMFCCDHLKLVHIGYSLHENVRQVKELILHCTKEIEGVEVITRRKTFL